MQSERRPRSWPDEAGAGRGFSVAGHLGILKAACAIVADACDAVVFGTLPVVGLLGLVYEVIKPPGGSLNPILERYGLSEGWLYLLVYGASVWSCWSWLRRR